MKILAFSDLHSDMAATTQLVKASAEADLVIIAGDFCNYHKDLAASVAPLADIPCPVLAVPGNHETIDELTAAAPKNITILHGQSHAIGSLTFFGIGYGVPVTPFGDWSCDLSESEATEMLENCHQVDVLISHSPPKGIADTTSGGISVGSTAVRAATERLKPKLLLCGHIHEAWGQTGKIEDTHVQNLGPNANWFEV
ncbi:metallophosphoesterase [Amylibacter sp. IMCC11727]|uniref:metallophosphoesterase family protein n=1 Tax=Amylibacter sp. IMCC11727 TaxID=3039851 RepID=UPI00244DBB3B|nr:metallophosphoesterase [Amylibacter sp. IMCC11727]WGI22737.1 metallophosphoesterase [Amylibacter sp. IMCC11727]